MVMVLYCKLCTVIRSFTVIVMLCAYIRAAKYATEVFGKLCKAEYELAEVWRVNVSSMVNILFELLIEQLQISTNKTTVRENIDQWKARMHQVRDDEYIDRHFLHEIMPQIQSTDSVMFNKNMNAIVKWLWSIESARILLQNHEDTYHSQIGLMQNHFEDLRRSILKNCSSQ